MHTCYRFFVYMWVVQFSYSLFKTNSSHRETTMGVKNEPPVAATTWKQSTKCVFQLLQGFWEHGILFKFQISALLELEVVISCSQQWIRRILRRFARRSTTEWFDQPHFFAPLEMYHETTPWQVTTRLFWTWLSSMVSCWHLDNSWWVVVANSMRRDEK